MANPPYIQLTLDVDDTYLSELGHELTLSSPRVWASRTKATTGLMYEELTRTVMLEMDREFDDYTDTVVEDWTLEGDAADWEALTGVPMFDYGSCLFHKNTSTTRRAATLDAAWQYNPDSMIGFWLYRPNTADDYVDISWGDGALRLRLQVGKHPLITFESEDWYIEGIPPLTEDQLHLRPRRLFVYFIHETMVVYSDFMPVFSWKPPRSIWEEHTWNDGSYDHVYIVPEGSFEFEAPGMFFVNAVELTYEETGEFLMPFALPYEPTETPSTDHEVEVFSGTGIAFSLRNDDDSGDYTTGDESGLLKFVFTGGGDATPYLRNCSSVWPMATSVRSGTNDGVRPNEIRELLSWDADSNTITFELYDDGTYANLQRAVNMKIQLSVNGVQRFTGYIDEPAVEWRGSKRFYVFEARDGMRKLQNAITMSDHRADGDKVTDTMVELIKRAGVAATDIAVTDNSTLLPDFGTGAEPCYLFPAGSNVLEACRNLAETWLPNWRFYCRYDGVYVFAPWSQGASELTFLKAIDTGAADSDSVIRELSEWNDDSQLRNFITVIGVDKDGNLISSTRYDSDSWSNPSASNYVGEPRFAVYFDGSLGTQEAVDIVSQAYYNELTVVRRFYQWRSGYYTSILPGSVVTLEGEGLVKILDIDTDLRDREGHAEYTGLYLGAA